MCDASGPWAPNGAEPAAVELFGLHRRYVEGDVSAGEAIACRLVPWTERALLRRWRLVPLDAVHDATVDALMEYRARPERFDPRRRSLGSFVFFAAERNLFDLVRTEGRRTRRDSAAAAPERTEAAQEGFLVEQESYERLLHLCARTPGEQAFAAALTDGERDAVVLARRGGCPSDSLPVMLQFRKRMKDRLRARLVRAGIRPGLSRA